MKNQPTFPFLTAPRAAALGFAVAAYAVAAPPAAKITAKSAAVKSAPAPTTQTNFTDNTPLTEEQRIVHALNRIGFGPRPGDVEKVKAMGLGAYIARQLQPEAIDDSAVEAKLAPFTALQMSNAELASSYYDGLKNGVKLKQFAAMAQENAKKNGDRDAASALAEMKPGDLAPNGAGDGKGKKLGALYQNLSPAQRTELREMMQAKRGGREGVLSGAVQMTVAKMVRATESNRQLNEVMADFWSNHFNIDMRKNACRAYKIADERDVARKYPLAKFRDLLGASAHSAAMLVYLDNAQSQVPQPVNPRRERLREAVIARQAASGNADAMLAQAAPKRGAGGVNENYAREIMELHTLGVDGGYTQKDVQEVARCLTGWGVARQTGEFQFTARRHDNGAKIVLGHTIPAGGGEKDGELVLDTLASHPATMLHISTKLCQRLVSDNPPASLVDKCVATWKKTDGDIREVVRTIVTSPEFFSRASYRQKIKSPFEYAVSSARALGGTYDLSGGTRPRESGLAFKAGQGGAGANATRTLTGQVSTMGQPLFQYQAPTGYPEDSRKWVSSGALISRLNFALALTGGKLNDVTLPASAIPTDMGVAPEKVVNAFADRFLYGDIAPSTRATLLKQARAIPEDADARATPSAARLAALVLGSPEFQRR